MRKRLLLGLSAGILLTLIAACGGDSSPASDGSQDGSAPTAAAKNDDSSPAASGQATQPAGSSDKGSLVADTGFRPDKDSYAFENFGNTYPETPGTLSIDEIRRMFGDAAVCEGGAKNGACDATPGAQAFLDAANKSSNGGHCEGFAITSLRFFLKLDDVSKFGADNIRALTLTGNEALKHQIAYYMASQMVDPSSSAARATRAQTPKDILATLSANMKEGKDLMTLGIYARKGGGHAITPYAIADKGDGVYWIMVYDNNYPGVERDVVIDTNKNTWLYDLAATKPGEVAEPWEGDAQSFSLDLTPLSARDGIYVCPWCGAKSLASAGAKGTQKKQVIFSGDGNLVVTDKAGHKLTYTNGKVTSDIPGGFVGQSRVRTDPEKSVPEVSIFLPDGVDFSIAMTGQGVPAGDTGKVKESLAVFGGGQAILVDGFDLDSNDTDVFTLNGRSASFKTSGTEKPHISLALDADNGPDYLYDLSDLDMVGNETLDFSVDEATGRFTVKEEGGQGDKYNLKVVRDDETGDHTFETHGLELAPGEADIVDAAKWDGQDGHTMPVGDDKNGDGQPEATVEEADEG
jgi:hypothetical protein